MISVAVALTVAYVAVAALLLNLNMATRWNVFVKIGTVVLVTGLYATAWQGHKELLGWATGEPLPDDFRVHWVTVDEPDKATGAAGTIYVWVRELDSTGLPHGQPRAYRLTWDEATAKAAEEALEQLKGGELLDGRLRHDIADPRVEPPPVEDANYNGGPLSSTTSGDRPQFEFSRVPPPALPPKPLPGG
jgi:hypothetical protein